MAVIAMTVLISTESTDAFLATPPEDNCLILSCDIAPETLFKKTTRKISSMFPEYRELISKLKGNHSRFDTLFETHNKLDHEVKRLENLFPSGSMEIVRLKLKKLETKREIQKILEQESKKLIQ